MIYKNFCGNEVSMLGFGCMRFTDDFEETKRNIDLAIKNGVNYFDTAFVYGDSELILGRILKEYPRDSFYVTSKMPAWAITKESDVEYIFNESLKRLQVDYIDYYLVHSVFENSIDKVIDFHIIEFLDRMRKEGKIKHLGFSIHAKKEILNKMLSLYPFEFVQIQLNYFDLVHEPGLEGYNIITEKNIPIVIMEPLKGGMLANLDATTGAPLKALPDFSSYAAYGFRYLMKYDNIHIILSGMSKENQVVSNLEIFKELKPLSIEEDMAVKKVVANIKKSYKVQCTGCRYCMPCPNGVDIPLNFKAWNTKNIAKVNSGWINDTELPNGKEATKCIGCGICATHCPQHIDIPSKLKELIKDFTE